MRPMLPSYREVQSLLQTIEVNHIYSNWGPLVRELESDYASYLGTQKELVVAVANATLALQGLVEISGIEKWFVPDYTFSATGLAVLKAGKTISFCDVDLNSWKMDLSSAGSDSEDVAVMAVVPFGAEVKLYDYKYLNNVVIDAAASLGRIPPKISDIQANWSLVYSLHATKVLGAGEGAIVVCGSEKVAKNLRAWINFGFDNERTSCMAGTNAKMSEFNAAYGLASLLNIESERNKWMESQHLVSELSVGRSWRTWVNQVASFQPYWIAQFENEQVRNYVQSELSSSLIQSRCWWSKPLSAQIAFTGCTTTGELSNSKILASTHLGLPMYQGLTESDVKMIINVIDYALKNIS
jgi:dTDP-4-amino-4,6-dideoxygalactose transaminase